MESYTKVCIRCMWYYSYWNSYAKQRNINIDSYSRTNYYDVESYCNAHSDNFYFVDLYSISDYEGGYHYNFFNKNEYVNFAMLGDWMG